MYYIGVDAGASKTHVVLATDDAIINELKSGPANPRIYGWPQTIKTIGDSIKSILSDKVNEQSPIKICVGIAGVNNKKDAIEGEECLTKSLELPNSVVRVTNDAIIASVLGSGNPNTITLICGTGSNCYGHSAGYNEAWVGGLDYILSDEASGYMIGSKALRAAVKSMDGRNEKTIIEPLLYKRYSVKSMREMDQLISKTHWTKTEIASCAVLVFEAAQTGDSVALQIINQTANEAIEMAVTAQAKLGIVEFECICVGGLFSEQLFKSEFIKQWEEKKIDGDLVFPETSPSYGALKLSKQLVSRGG